MKITNKSEINWQHVKNIIFDLGGVILNLNFNATIEKFKQYGVNGFEYHFTQKVQSNLFRKFERGHIEAPVLRKELKNIAEKPITDTQIDESWNAMILDTPMERLQLLTRLKKQYKVFLLSNTNSIHIHCYYQKVRDENKVWFPDYFHNVYLSYEIGMRKPDAEIFNFVLSNAGIKPGDTLFIDDTEVNTDTAAALGFQSFHLQNGTEITDIFKK